MSRAQGTGAAPGTIALVAGSGILLDPILDSIDATIPFAAMGLPEACVKGHDCRFVTGMCGTCRVIVQCGRFHFYEGFDYETVSRTVDCLTELGARAVIFTNTAGGLLPALAPGDLIAVDRLRLCRYRRWTATPGILIPDFQIPGCDHAGTYQWVPGPCYETRAEIAAVQNMGAAAIGMSTAPELMRCQELRISAAVIACITNACAKPERLAHETVLAAANRASGKIRLRIQAALPALAASISKT